MSRIRLKKVDQISRKTVSDARDGLPLLVHSFVMK